MQTIAAAVTMVRDDPVFLAAWLRHYGRALGRENCYVVSHGREPQVAQMAEGCNLIGIPGDPHPNFDMKRWRLLNGLVQGLRGYYRHVIVGDVDELVAVDPASGRGLVEFLERRPAGRVLTPLGLEVIHRPELEADPVDTRILGPRRHLRLAPHYSKPCVISTGVKIARGGHYTEFDRLMTPENLYLFHLKYCDLPTYSAVMDDRNARAAATGAGVQQAAIGRHWFAQARSDDTALFAGFAELPMQEGFDLGWVRAAMKASWRPREDTGFWQFDRPDYAVQYRLPDRFVGMF
ncbi:MAG: glycosyltransferase family 2 protein [Roseivivax sp.]|nr:glycosyltransferase family 2 protein [Roseivivax sp.]